MGKHRLPKGQISGLPVGYGGTAKEQIRWIDGHYETIKHWFRGEACFLELDVSESDAKDRFAAFLGHDLPWWGQANSNANPGACRCRK